MDKREELLTDATKFVLRNVKEFAEPGTSLGHNEVSTAANTLADFALSAITKERAEIAADLRNMTETRYCGDVGKDMHEYIEKLEGKQC